MSQCSFDRLLQLLDRKLRTNEQLQVFSHLDRCEICRDTIYHIVRDRDEELRILLPRRKKATPSPMRVENAGKSRGRTAA